MPRCIVKGCKTVSGRTRDVTLHSVPRHEPQRSKWLAALGMPELISSEKRILVCSKHFTLNSYELYKALPQALRYLRLRNDALPFINLGSNIESGQDCAQEIQKELFSTKSMLQEETKLDASSGYSTGPAQTMEFASIESTALVEFEEPGSRSLKSWQRGMEQYLLEAETDVPFVAMMEAVGEIDNFSNQQETKAMAASAPLKNEPVWETDTFSNQEIREILVNPDHQQETKVMAASTPLKVEPVWETDTFSNQETREILVNPDHQQETGAMAASAPLKVEPVWETDTFSNQENREILVNPDQLQIDNTFEDIEKYFNKDEWAELQDWEKEVYRSLKEHYDAIISFGYIEFPKPDFMTKVKENYQLPVYDSPHSQEDESPIKPVTNTTNNSRQSPLQVSFNNQPFHAKAVLKPLGNIQETENSQQCVVQTFKELKTVQSNKKTFYNCAECKENYNCLVKLKRHLEINQRLYNDFFEKLQRHLEHQQSKYNYCLDKLQKHLEVHQSKNNPGRSSEKNSSCLSPDSLSKEEHREERMWTQHPNLKGMKDHLQQRHQTEEKKYHCTEGQQVWVLSPFQQEQQVLPVFLIPTVLGSVVAEVQLSTSQSRI
nr:PREDICTED: uncharacterized protein LOC106703257 isoform X1 [Latimeria chalumnae]XP_014343217.1 PREDICTED: uncharacterized protein LOC106703257 isoform X1 [Latimeria chalumnae]|eukprot:XP_014343216.1 PREDICTED: uncharacterized protein LOC106703257 isoform X1 [Latimeria chalumnae]